MGRVALFRSWRIGIVCAAALFAGPSYADEPDAQKQDSKKQDAVLDCRYDRADVGERSETFPSDDVFRPLMADPKQPQFFALWQSQETKGTSGRTNIGSVGIGENFGFYTKRQGCNGWQISLLTGIFAQFNLDTSNAALNNIDFNVGVPLTWRSGPWSARLRYYHQSSHLGDEFIAANPGFRSISLTFEEVDMIVSYDAMKWLRLYGGGAVMVNRDPTTIQRNQVQWGFEARTVMGQSQVFGLLSNPVFFSPVLTADFKSVEEQGWHINTNLLAGVDMSRAGSFKRLRILFNFYNGYNPYGQFFYSHKTESFGLGAYFMF